MSASTTEKIGGTIQNTILFTLTDVPTPKQDLCFDIYGETTSKKMKRLNEHLLALTKAGWQFITDDRGNISISTEDKHLLIDKYRRTPNIESTINYNDLRS